MFALSENFFILQKKKEKFQYPLLQSGQGERLLEGLYSLTVTPYNSS